MELKDLEIRIGSAPDNDIVLEHALVEEYQCRLIRRGGGWYLEDRSQGGTIANAGKVNGTFPAQYRGYYPDREDVVGALE